MTTRVFEKQYFIDKVNSTSVKVATHLAIRIINIYRKKVLRVYGGDYVRNADQALNCRQSVLVACNHPNTLQSMFVDMSLVGEVSPQKIKANYIKRSLLPTPKEHSEHNRLSIAQMGKQVLQNLLDHYGFIVIPVATDSTDSNRDVQFKFNFSTGRQANKLLQEKQMLIIFPEGTRSKGMLEGQSGIRLHLNHSDNILICATTNNMTIEFLGFLSKQDIFSAFTDEEIPFKLHRELLSQLIMTKIAGALPTNRQGFYAPYVEAAKYPHGATEDLQDFANAVRAVTQKEIMTFS